MEKETGNGQNNIGSLIEECAEDLYENAPCGYLSTLPNGSIVKVNRTFLEWLGYTREELLHQKKFQDLLPIGGKLYYETHLDPLLRMQGLVNEVNFELKAKDGHRLPVLINTAQVKGQNGEPLFHRTTVFNITDRKRYELELLHAKKEAEAAAKIKAEFLSTVSHEIRTPMNAIIGIANLLQEMEHTQEQEEYLRTLKHSAHNLLQLINDILDYSKIEAGKVELNERSLDLKELAQTLLYSVGITAEEKGLFMKVDLDERLPASVIGDPVKIGQVLTNLLGNAIKFTSKGYVALRLKVQEIIAKEVAVTFEVEDTGIGIPEDKLQKIFEEFTQANYEINLKYGGTGLGLAISQKLLGLYGSKLFVESQEGKGTTFRFTLRLQVEEEPDKVADDVAPSDEASPIKGVKLLLVEDNPVNVLVVTKYLERWGVLFDVAGNGLEAVEKIILYDYDLVLMDLQMPGLDGYEATSRVRQLTHEKYRQLPIIALSASARFDYKERMEVAGINDFISKPFNAEELQAKIFHYTSKTETLQSLKVASSEQAQAPAWQPESHDPDGPILTLTTFQELLEGDEMDLEELVSMTIRNFEGFRKDFLIALETRNLTAYRFSSHKIKMTVELLHAGRLLSAINRGRSLLENGSPDQQSTCQLSHELDQEFHSVIEELKEIRASRWQKRKALPKTK